MINLDLFSSSLRDVAIATNFGQNWQNDLYSAGWRSETGIVSDIAIFVLERDVKHQLTNSETGRNMAVPIQKYSTAIL